MTVVRVWWGWLRVAVVDTLWPTEHGKSAQSITNICPWKSELTFQCTRSFFLKRIKTLANLPQSANTVVKLTGLPDLLHTFTQKKKKNLSASSGYEWAMKCWCRHTTTYSTPWISHYSQERKEKKQNTNIVNSCQRLHFLKKRKEKPVAINGKISCLSEVWNSRHCLACLQFSGFRNWGCSSLGVWKNPVKWTVTVGSLTLRNTQKFSLTIADGIQHTSSKD